MLLITLLLTKKNINGNVFKNIYAIKCTYAKFKMQLTTFIIKTDKVKKTIL